MASKIQQISIDAACIFSRLMPALPRTATPHPAPGELGTLYDSLGAGNKNRHTHFGVNNETTNPNLTQPALSRFMPIPLSSDYTPAPGDWEHQVIPGDLVKQRRAKTSPVRPTLQQADHAHFAAQRQHTGSWGTGNIK
ncbi:hypothetical protein N7457_001224 [Penicillium paradoxum]|uniref:uncharacterized protein n=1 Tax=Penicillium paradoxum TaxID=176176 RepID=UPI002548604A|nr:uncharacterized protein N7457_001224 [Penicillium paradoxum]KAJ5794625.1 hypothetical protein N7457_001224 [Penicillium paradoxum]